MNMKYYVQYRAFDHELYEMVGITQSQKDLDEKAFFSITKKEAMDLLPCIKDEKSYVFVPRTIIDEKQVFSFVTEKKDEFVIKKEEAAKVLNDYYQRVMNSVALFEMYNVMLINNELGANGYFITSTNREEVYIDIINSGDEKLITLLQEYLEAKDKIDPMMTYYNKLKEAKLKLKEAKTVEEIDPIVEDVLNFLSWTRFLSFVSSGPLTFP